MAAVPKEAPAHAAVTRAATPSGAAGLLYERYYDRVVRYCFLQLGNRDEAEDAAQTAFLHALRALSGGVVPGHEEAWLFAIARNSCIARYRERGRTRAVEAPSDPYILQQLSAAVDPERDELIGLESALQAMPEQQRKALLLREWQGLSYREIAVELGLTGPAVETLLFRARRSLAQLLTSQPGEQRRRGLRALDLGTLLAGLKSAFGGVSAVKVGVGLASAAALALSVQGAAEREPVSAPGPAPRELSQAPVGEAADRLEHAALAAQAVARQGDAPKRQSERSRPSGTAVDPAGTSASSGAIERVLPQAGPLLETTIGTVGSTLPALPLPGVSALPLPTQTPVLEVGVPPLPRTELPLPGAPSLP